MERAKSGDWKTLLPKYTITVASRETRNAALATSKTCLWETLISVHYPGL